ncbi:MAG: GNAT superfamily N-acetyltransferase [Oceanospirillaceae bacterium]|jgi:GNAT superfamily N-acetyltransferase
MSGFTGSLSIGFTMNLSHTKIPQFDLRFGVPSDAALVVQFMKKLGVFQKMENEITATPDRIELLLKLKQGEVVIGLYDGEPVAFAYFYEKSSAFTGRSGLFIDGFFIEDSMRGKGLGNIMMQFLSKTALERGCEMLEWGCLDWNTFAIEFYQKIGAYCIDTMRIYRLSPDDLTATAIRF